MRRRETFEKLVAWQRAMDLVALVYKLTEAFPDSEKSGLTASLKKAAAAIPPKVADAAKAAEAGEDETALRLLEGSQAAMVELFNIALVARRINVMGRRPLAKLSRVCRKLDARIGKDIERLELRLEAQAEAEDHAKADEAVRLQARVVAREAALVLAMGKARQQRRETRATESVSDAA